MRKEKNIMLMENLPLHTSVVQRKPNFLKHIFAALIIFSLNACTTIVSLKYIPPPTLTKMSPSAYSLAVGTFLDSRNESSNWLGNIRGGWGNPLKELKSDRSVVEMVKAAFEDGLRARGIIINQAPAQNQITGTIKKLYCDQVVQREAIVEIDVAVLNKNGQALFTRTYASKKIEGKMFSGKQGVFGSVENLRKTLEKTLQETIDKALDDSALWAALQI